MITPQMFFVVVLVLAVFVLKTPGEPEPPHPERCAHCGFGVFVREKRALYVFRWYCVRCGRWAR
jgi:hypothetical protein